VEAQHIPQEESRVPPCRNLPSGQAGQNEAIQDNVLRDENRDSRKKRPEIIPASESPKKVKAYRLSRFTSCSGPA
jgi:hypothetical protein